MFYIRKFLYQVRNMTVVVHSFDVFELLILPLFWLRTIRFEYPWSSVFLWFYFLNWLPKINVHLCHLKGKLNDVCVLLTNTYLVVNVLQDSPPSVRYASNASSYQWETDLMVSGCILYNYVHKHWLQRQQWQWQSWMVAWFWKLSNRNYLK